MNVEYLIQLLENKLIILNNAKIQHFNSGDLDAINKLDTEVLGVQETLSKLRILLQAMSSASEINSSLNDVVKNGIENTKIAQTIPLDPTRCMSEYDITPYATDPLHEQKIADILMVMGGMDTAADIDAYIDSEAIGSPLTGAMILSAAVQYSVDCRLLIALMELDSRFGTAGVAVSTYNPGNVGNTGSATRTYSSWTEGVLAVADWLNRHRINKIDALPVVTALTFVDKNLIEEPESIDTSLFATSTTPVATETISTSTPISSTPTIPVTPIAPVPPVVVPVSGSSTSTSTSTATSTPVTPIFDPITSTTTSTSTTPVIDPNPINPVPISGGDATGTTASTTPIIITPVDPIVDPITSTSTPSASSTEN